mgnify:CR=1 FL=1
MEKLTLTEAEKSQIYDAVEEQVYRDEEESPASKYGDEGDTMDDRLGEQINSQYEAILNGQYGDRKELIELGYISTSPPKFRHNKRTGAKLM